MTALPLCAQPGCLYAAVAGTDRCLPHTEPGKGDGSYHGVYHREGAWPAPEPAAEQAPVAARPYTEVTGIPIERADWEYFGRVARQAVIGSELCAYHLQLGPREMIEELGPVTRDGNTFTVTQPGVYQLGGSVWPFGPPPAVEPAPLPVPRPYLKPALEAAKPNPPATEPGPGWLARAFPTSRWVERLRRPDAP